MTEKSENTRVGNTDVLLVVDKIEPLVDEDVQLDWDAFEKYVLTEYRKTSANNIMRYCRRLHYLVTTVDGPNRIRTDLLTLRPVAKLEAMKALACLTRYMGVHDEWNKLRKQFGLRWSTFSAEAEAKYFEETFYNDSVNLTAMISWIRKVKTVLPDKHAAFIDFCTLTGLRQANILEAEGEAAAIQIIDEQLRNNPNYLEWLKTQQWDGVLPLVTGGGGATPFIEIPSGNSVQAAGTNSSGNSTSTGNATRGP